jgi:hypothetical protein
MRVLLSAVAVAGALAVGGVPAIMGMASGGERGPTVVTARASGAPSPHGHADGHDHGPTSAHAQQMVEIAHAHRDAMHAWSACVRQAAKANPGTNPTLSCVKPEPPGHVKNGKSGHAGHADHPDKPDAVKPGHLAEPLLPSASGSASASESPAPSLSPSTSDSASGSASGSPGL